MRRPTPAPVRANRSMAHKSLAGLAVAAAALSLATPAAFAKGKGGGTTQPTPPAVTTCAKVTVANSPQIVRNRAMPDIKFNLVNCGTQAVAATVTVTETAGIFSVSCPSPVAAPMPFALAPGQKQVATAPVFRGPCGMVSQTNSAIFQSPLMWQGHNLLLTLTDDATGAVLSTSAFSWHDIPPKGV